MNRNEILTRTKQFSVRIIKLSVCLNKSVATRVISNQILRSGTAVGANYRSSCRAKSNRDFICKLKIVEEETDETLFWLELLEEANLVYPEKLASLKKEANELLSIFVASLKTLRKNQQVAELNRKS